MSIIFVVYNVNDKSIPAVNIETFRPNISDQELFTFICVAQKLESMQHSFFRQELPEKDAQELTYLRDLHYVDDSDLNNKKIIRRKKIDILLTCNGDLYASKRYKAIRGSTLTLILTLIYEDNTPCFYTGNVVIKATRGILNTTTFNFDGTTNIKSTEWIAPNETVFCPFHCKMYDNAMTPISKQLYIHEDKQLNIELINPV